MVAAALIAAISLHALMRHQNHRRMNTSPAPAPIAIRNLQADEIESMYSVATPESNAHNNVATRDAFT